MEETTAAESSQGYFTVCRFCGKEKKVNLQGQEIGIGSHICVPSHECVTHRRYIGEGKYRCEICGSIAELSIGTGAPEGQRERVHKIKQLFESIACLCFEGPELFPRRELMESIQQEASKGYGICKELLTAMAREG